MQGPLIRYDDFQIKKVNGLYEVWLGDQFEGALETYNEAKRHIINIIRSEKTRYYVGMSEINNY